MQVLLASHFFSFERRYCCTLYSKQALINVFSVCFLVFCSAVITTAMCFGVILVVVHLADAVGFFWLTTVITKLS